MSASLSVLMLRCLLLYFHQKKTSNFKFMRNLLYNLFDVGHSRFDTVQVSNFSSFVFRFQTFNHNFLKGNGIQFYHVKIKPSQLDSKIRAVLVNLHEFVDDFPGNLPDQKLFTLRHFLTVVKE